MSFDCATYASQTAADIGALRNWTNYVKEQVPLGIPAKTPEGEIIYSLDGLTDEQIEVLRLVGSKDGKLITDNGTTTAFVRVSKATMSDLWFYPLPDEKYMIGVSGYTVLPYDPAWDSSPE